LSAARENARPTIISVAGGDVQGMLAIPSRHELWVSCPKEKMIAIVDTQSLALTGQISVPVGDRPTPFALSPDQSTVYVTAKHGEILTISTATRQFHSIPIARRIGDLALSADGRYLYIAAVFEGLKKVDTSTGRVTNIETAIAPTFLAVDPTRNLLYIAYRNGGPTGREGHDAIGILDLNNDKSVGILQGPPLVGGHLAVSPGGEFLLADGTDACYQPRYDHAGCPGTGPVIQVFHLPTHQLTKTILAQPSDWVSPISFTPDASAILTGGNHLRAYDARSFNAEEYSPDWLGSNNGMFAFAGDHLFMQIEGRGIAALPLDQGRSDPPQTGLTSFWPGEGVPADIAGLNNAICTPAVRYVPGRVGQAFGFEGKDARCEVNSTRRFLFTAEPGTISFWAKLSSRRGEMVLLDQSDRDEQVGWQILVDARNTLIFQYISPGQSRLTSAKPLQPETWHHIAVTRTDTSISLYLDAILQSSTPVRATPDPAKHLTFGSTSNGSSPFYGKLDDIAFHLRALEHAELLRAAQSK
jgi:hypothetical protein